MRLVTCSLGDGYCGRGGAGNRRSNPRPLRLPRLLRLGGSPLSGLRLADGAHLFLATVLAFLDLSAAPLVTLSACETALSDILKAPEEYVGLPAGFVRAGASGVVSAIWAVYDLAAAVLIDRFYGLHVGDGLPPAEALRRAQLWMRDATATDMQLAEWFERQVNMDPAHRDAALVGAEYFRENPDEKCFSHPVFWAPFTYVGA